MDDVMGLSVGSFAEDEACSWIKSTVLQLRDDHAGVMELVRYLGCLPLAIGLASAHAGVHGTSSPAEFLAAFKRVAPPPHEQLEVGAKVEMHSLNATELNGKPWRAARAPRRGSAPDLSPRQHHNGVEAQRTIVPAQQRQVRCAHPDAAAFTELYCPGRAHKGAAVTMAARRRLVQNPFLYLELVGTWRCEFLQNFWNIDMEERVKYMRCVRNGCSISSPSLPCTEGEFEKKAAREKTIASLKKQSIRQLSGPGDYPEHACCCRW
jgi:hypothetical protein